MYDLILAPTVSLIPSSWPGWRIISIITLHTVSGVDLDDESQHQVLSAYTAFMLSSAWYACSRAAAELKKLKKMFILSHPNYRQPYKKILG